jgi:triosephosphate isomerase
MRKKIVAGNWKMNMDKNEAMNLYNSLRDHSDSFPENVEVILAPPYLYLDELNNKSSKINISAQNCSSNNNGAFTGEISASMLRSIGVNSAIVGHSERRHIFGESIRECSEKVMMLLNQNMQVIFCVGEQLRERKADTHFKIISDQLESILSLEPVLFEKVVVAYEPVWAIGTGETASPDQAQEMHSFIRSKLNTAYGNLSSQTRILYGGSVKPNNAAEIFSKTDVDGGLIGGAALNAESFVEIIKAAE